MVFTQINTLGHETCEGGIYQSHMDKQGILPKCQYYRSLRRLCIAVVLICDSHQQKYCNKHSSGVVYGTWWDLVSVKFSIPFWFYSVFLEVHLYNKNSRNSGGSKIYFRGWFNRPNMVHLTLGVNLRLWVQAQWWLSTCALFHMLDHYHMNSSYSYVKGWLYGFSTCKPPCAHGGHAFHSDAGKTLVADTLICHRAKLKQIPVGIWMDAPRNDGHLRCRDDGAPLSNPRFCNLKKIIQRILSVSAKRLMTQSWSWYQALERWCQFTVS